MKYILLSIIAFSFFSCIDAELYGYDSKLNKVDSTVKFIPFVPSDSVSNPADTILNKEDSAVILNQSNFYIE